MGNQTEPLYRQDEVWEYISDGSQHGCRRVKSMDSGLPPHLAWSQQKQIYFYRSSNHLQNIVRVLSVVCDQNKYNCTGPNCTLKVRTQHIPYRLSQIWNLTMQQAAFIIQATAIASKQILDYLKHPFHINHNMIGFTPTAVVKVWMGQNFGKNYQLETDINITSHRALIDQILTSIVNHTTSKSYTNEFNDLIENATTVELLIEKVGKYLKNKNKAQIQLSILSKALGKQLPRNKQQREIQKPKSAIQNKNHQQKNLQHFLSARRFSHCNESPPKQKRLSHSNHKTYINSNPPSKVRSKTSNQQICFLPKNQPMQIVIEEEKIPMFIRNLQSNKNKTDNSKHTKQKQQFFNQSFQHHPNTNRYYHPTNSQHQPQQQYHLQPKQHYQQNQQSKHTQLTQKHQQQHVFQHPHPQPQHHPQYTLQQHHPRQHLQQSQQSQQRNFIQSLKTTKNKQTHQINSNIKSNKNMKHVESYNYPHKQYITFQNTQQIRTTPTTHQLIHKPIINHQPHIYHPVIYQPIVHPHYVFPVSPNNRNVFFPRQLQSKHEQQKLADQISETKEKEQPYIQSKSQSIQSEQKEIESPSSKITNKSIKKVNHKIDFFNEYEGNRQLTSIESEYKKYFIDEETGPKTNTYINCSQKIIEVPKQQQSTPQKQILQNINQQTISPTTPPSQTTHQSKHKHHQFKNPFIENLISDNKKITSNTDKEVINTKLFSNILSKKKKQSHNELNVGVNNKMKMFHNDIA